MCSASQMESTTAGLNSCIHVESSKEALVLILVVTQQLLTALEVSQRIPRSVAKKLTFELFHQSAG